MTDGPDERRRVFGRQRWPRVIHSFGPPAFVCEARAFVARRASSGRQRQPLVVLPALQVVVEEVAIKNRLHGAGYPHCEAASTSARAPGALEATRGRTYPVAVARLVEVAVDPVQQVQCAVCPARANVRPRAEATAPLAVPAPQEENVMPRQIVHVPRVLQHHLQPRTSAPVEPGQPRTRTRQLRQDGHRLQVDGERPEYLRRDERASAARRGPRSPYHTRAPPSATARGSPARPRARRVR